MEQSVLSEKEPLENMQLPHENQSFESLKIILKIYKKQPLYYKLLDLTFIQKDFRNVYAFFVSGKQINLYERSILKIQNLIKSQNLEKHFYMNSGIIVSFHFIHEVINLALTDKEGIKLFQEKGLNIGMSSYREMRNDYRKELKLYLYHSI